MKKFKIIIIIAALLGINSAKAQQLPMFTQYMFNDYVLNPAIGGTNDYYQVKTNYRYQWAKIDDGPKTYVLSAYGPHKTMPMGYGGYILNDVTGPLTKTGLYGSYAYNVKVTGDIRLSMGVFIGFMQYKIDLSSIEFEDLVDPILANGDKWTKVTPDASFGLYLYTSQYYAGFSANQLLGNKIVLDTINISGGLNRLKGHYYLTGGYKYNINRDFDIEPSLFLKFLPRTPIQADINIKTIYQKMLWAGLSYRTREAVSILLGYNYNDMIYIGYSYDLTISDFSQYCGATHEIMIGVKFNRIKQAGGTMRKIR